MPTTLGGLILTVVLLVPGFIHYVQRRTKAPQRALSPLVETATLATVSVVTNLTSLGIFALTRAIAPDHTPDVGRLLSEGATYVFPRISYVVGWGVALLTFSSFLAFIAGARIGPVGWVSQRFAPTIVDVSAWFHVFEEGPASASVFVGCDLDDGAFVSGTLDWYSTEVVESADRDFVLASPIGLRPAGADVVETLEGVARIVLSAREVTRMYVSYVSDESSPN